MLALRAGLVPSASGGHAHRVDRVQADGSPAVRRGWGRPVFAIDEVASGCRFVVTDRHGGVSTAPFGTLNLGGHVGDDADAVRRNRGLVAEALGVEADHLIFADQVHGDQVVHVDGPWTGRPPSCDAIVTTRADLALAVLVADCVPVLLAAPDEGVIGVAHAGRAGMAAAGIALRLVDAMRDLGARTILGRVGPSVCARYPRSASCCGDRLPSCGR